MKKRMQFPWRRTALTAAAMMLATGCAMAQGAVIDSGAGPLNVRVAPDQSAAVVGQFFSGTQVSVVCDAGGGYSQIAIGTGSGVINGYAATQYLAQSAGVNATREAAVASPYGTQSVVLRDQPSNSYHPVAMLMVGDRVLVIGEMNGFCFVQTAGGCVGCLLESEVK